MKLDPSSAMVDKDQKFPVIVAKFDYKAIDGNELSITKGEKLKLLDDTQHWWKVMNAFGNSGYVPSNYCKKSKQGLFSSLRNTLGRKKTKTSERSSSKGRSPSRGMTPSADHLVDGEGGGMTRSHMSVGSSGDMARLHRVRLGDECESDDGGLNSNEGTLDMPGGHKPPPSMPPYHQIGDFSPAQLLQSNLLANAASQQSRNGTSGPTFPHSLIASVPLPDTVSPGESAARTSSQMESGEGPDMDENALTYCVAKFSYSASQSDELSVTKGDIIRVLEQSSDGWWKGQLEGEGTPGPVGWFPSNYAEITTQHPASALKANRSTPGTSHNTSQGSLGDAGNWPTNDVTKSASRNGPSSADEGRSSKAKTVGDDVIHIVITLYTFVKKQEEELSFEANTTLQIIGKPEEDPDWWQARNSHGKTGLVPRNYVRIIDTPSNSASRAPSSKTEYSNGQSSPLRRKYHSDDPDLQFGDKPWYWGFISRNDCESMLIKYARVGEFAVRDSESHPGDLTVTVFAGDKNRNFKVQVRDKLYHIGQKVFDGVDELIEHYRTHPIYKSDQERLYLTQPFRYPNVH